ncbi:MAG: MSCRAMM family adhesin SdrC [Candidatus Obscuribacterales bacterium]|jgi:hypothetical protein|nr:MSCRAMM family adhesin SdrC [Candidatus Obscuribacterales bacterium]
MDQLVENLRKSVEEYNSIPPDGSKVQATRDIVAALAACREFLKENDKDERGQTSRFVRDISEWMAPIPTIRALMTDRNRINKLHTTREADEFLDEVQAELEKGTKELEDSRVKIIQDWVRFHPVLKGLKRVASKRLPKDAYVLLFEQKESENPKLITRASKDGRVLTRFHPREFSNEARLYQAYHGRDPLVGAAVISKNELIQVIGKVPEASEGQEQLKALTSISKKAVGQPGREFVERNDVLKHIHSLCRKRKIDRQDYILLFETADFKPRKQQQASSVEAVEAEEVQFSPAKKRAEGAQSAAAAARTTEEPSNGDLTDESTTSEQHADLAAPAELVAENAETSGDFEAACSEDILPEGIEEDLDSDDDGEASLESDDESVDLEASNEDEEAADSAHDLDDEADSSSDLDEDPLEASGNDEEAEENGDVLDSSGEEISADAEPSASEEQSQTDSPAEQIEVAQAQGTEDGASLDAPADKGGGAAAASSSSDQPAGKAGKQPKSSKVRLIVRQSEDGRVITRFRFFDFSDSRKLFEQFKGKAPVVGAAVIRGRELVHAIGMLPSAKGSQSQVDALLDQSRKAMEGPAITFIADNEVLAKLQELNASSPRDSNLEVVLFIMGQGRPEPLSISDARGYSRSQFPLTDFRNPKFVFDRLQGQAPVIGASVISQPAQQERGGFGNRGRDDRRDNRNQDRGGKGTGGPGFRGGQSRGSSRPSTPVVVHAFGQTPLKQNILLTPETLKRMNISLVLR